MTPIHHQVKSLLMPVLLAATEAARTAAERSQEKVLHPRLDEMKGYISTADREWGTAVSRYIVPVMIALFDPERIYDWSSVLNKGDEGKLLTLFSCVKFNGGVYTVGQAIKRQAYSPKLVPSSVPPLKFTIASEEEVENWLDALTPAALKQILITGEFAPALAAMFEDQTELAAGEEEVEIDPFNLQIGDIVKAVYNQHWRWAGQDFDSKNKPSLGVVIGTRHNGNVIGVDPNEEGWVTVKWENGNHYFYPQLPDEWVLEPIDRPSSVPATSPG